MLTATSLTAFKRDLDEANRYQVESFIRQAVGRGNRHKITWELNEHGIDMRGQTVALDPYVRNGKLLFKFNQVISPLCTLNGVRTLENMPKRVDGSVDIRSSWLTSLQGGPETAGVYFVAADKLTDLVGAPRVASKLMVHSADLSSFYGLEHTSITDIDVRTCICVDTTNGLSGAAIGSNLSLPCSIDMITDLPSYCSSLSFSPTSKCQGFSKLFGVPGLTMIGSNESGSATYKAYPALNRMLDEIDEPRKRQLAAEQILIDFDLEDYI